MTDSTDIIENRTHLPGDSPDDLLSLHQVAKSLGVVTATARLLVREGKLPGKRLGRYWRVRREDLEIYIASELRS